MNAKLTKTVRVKMGPVGGGQVGVEGEKKIKERRTSKERVGRKLMIAARAQVKFLKEKIFNSET